jgi:hypothetical protein
MNNLQTYTFYLFGYLLVCIGWVFLPITENVKIFILGFGFHGIVLCFGMILNEAIKTRNMERNN